MYKGIYIALSGAVLKQAQMEVISQNLANADTVGYKKRGVLFKDHLLSQGMATAMPDGRAMTDLSLFTTDFSSGNLVKTGNPLDIAVDGKGFVALEGDRYTRRGDLKRDDDGYLVTYQGLKVMGAKGPIQLPKGKVEIGEKGEVSVKGTKIDSIRIVEFQRTDNLDKVSDSVFTSADAPIESSGWVKQGFLESSNVDVIKEMVRMIETLREYEAYQKAIHSFDDASAKLTNDMGRV